jgi:hypothetical protein
VSEWLIALPVWGKHYRETFRRHVWPSIKTALAPLDAKVRFLVHTDDQAFMRKLLAGYEVDVRSPVGTFHAAYANCHRDALDRAHWQERVALLNADIVVSREAFVAAERRFGQFYRAVVCAASRTIGPLFGREMPQDVSSADLLHWSMTHAHPMVQQCFYPQGKGAVPWGLYFTDGTNTILRAWHLHPFAVVKDQNFRFTGTIDRDLCNTYWASEVHVVTDKDELALVEISPLDRRLPLLPDAMSHEYLAWWAGVHASKMHRKFFAKRIVIEGSADTNCDAPAQDILDRLNGRNIVSGYSAGALLLSLFARLFSFGRASRMGA